MARKRLELRGEQRPGFEEILTPDALEFIGALEDEFDDRRIDLLEARRKRRARLNEGETLDFLEETASIREDDWTVAPVPDRWPSGGSRSPAPPTARWSSTR